MHLTAARLNRTAFVSGRVSPFDSFFCLFVFNISPTLAGLIP